MNALDAILDAATRRAWLADAHAQEALERAAALAARCERLRQEITFAQIRFRSVGGGYISPRQTAHRMGTLSR
jgi:hypothetical protein